MAPLRALNLLVLHHRKIVDLQFTVHHLIFLLELNPPLLSSLSWPQSIN